MIMKYVVKELYIYPIKSLAGITVNSAQAQEMGFENDRRWMLIDENNKLITQREYPHLSQFYPKIIDDNIEITHQDVTHEFFIHETLEEPIASNVWEDETKVFEVNKATSKWFSEALGFECKLVKIGNIGDRKHHSSKLETTINVSLADGYPYLLIGSESLNFLNHILKEKISMARFRPNIVISSFIAHEEDSFGNFQIGNVNFKNAKPCGRCIMINNDPKNGVVKKEPLKTLSTYRNVHHSILFGTNVMCLNEGEIAVGDTLLF